MRRHPTIRAAYVPHVIADTRKKHLQSFSTAFSSQEYPIIRLTGLCLIVLDRIARIEGILRVIEADAAEPERVKRAEASVARLRAQLADLQAGEGPLAEQVRASASLCDITADLCLECCR